MTTATPPDCWDHQEEVRPPSGNKLKKNGNDRRPILTVDEEDARRVWVLAMRTYHEARTGEPSRYDSSPAWDGGICQQSGRQYKNAIWPAFVAKAASAGYSPRELVEVLFSSWANDTAPTPHAVTADANIQRAAKNRLIRRRRVADSLRTEEALYRADLWGAMQATPDKREAIRFVLNDTSRSLSPLFRYSIATLSGLNDVAERWERTAVAQFQADAPAYLEHWSALVPDTIKQPAPSAAV